MPVAQIHLLKGHTREALRQIIVDVSDAMAMLLGAPKERLFVWITEHEHDLWGSAGIPADEALRDRDQRDLEMPLVQMILMERPKEQLHAIMAAVTTAVAKGAKCDAKRIRVHLAPASPDGWSIGGVPASISRAAEIAAARARSVP